jgi:hypothetical protein
MAMTAEAIELLDAQMTVVRRDLDGQVAALYWIAACGQAAAVIAGTAWRRALQ